AVRCRPNHRLRAGPRPLCSWRRLPPGIGRRLQSLPAARSSLRQEVRLIGFSLGCRFWVRGEFVEDRVLDRSLRADIDTDAAWGETHLSELGRGLAWSL